MADVTVTRTAEDGSRLSFDVTVNEGGSTSRHVVTLSRDDYAGQGDRWPNPEAFVSRCFDFLLARESKESILARFDVRDIGRYFPEFDHDLLHPEG